MVEIVFFIITIWRFIPAFIAFHSLQDKQAVSDDMRRWGENETLWSLHKLLVRSKLFRRLCSRCYFQENWGLVH